MTSGMGKTWNSAFTWEILIPDWDKIECNISMERSELAFSEARPRHLHKVCLVLYLQDGPPGPELGEDAAGPPHVNGPCVRSLSQQELGGPIPQRHHAVGILFLEPNMTDGPGKAKVGNF